jgi:HEAT repeat protein
MGGEMGGGAGSGGDMEMAAGVDMGGGMDMSMELPGGYDMETSKKDASKPRLVYDSRTYSQWLKVLETERKPERLIDALTAVKVLGPEAGSEEAARAVLHVMRAFGSTSVDSSPEGKLIENAYQTLGRMHPPAVAKALVSEIREGNDRSRDFMKLFLGTIVRPMAYGETTRWRATERWAGPLMEVAPEVVPLIISMSRGSDAGVRQWSLGFGARFAGAVGIEAAEAENLCDRLFEALRDADRGTVLIAAKSLSDLLPNTEGLAEILASFIGDSDTMRKITAIQALGQLGPKGEPAVPKLADALKAQPLEKHVMGMGGYPPYGSTGLALYIIQALESIGPAAKAAIPALNKFASEENTYQDAAKRAIAKIEMDADDP